MTKRTIEQEVRRLAAIEDIKQLKARYCAHCDDNYNPEGISNMFVEDGIWDGASFGVHKGKEEIHNFFSGISGDIVFAGHLVVNPIIDVADDAESATGKWWLIMPCTVNEEDKNEARWLLGEYTDEYVCVDGNWMYKSLKLNLHHFVPYLKGWA